MEVGQGVGELLALELIPNNDISFKNANLFAHAWTCKYDTYSYSTGAGEHVRMEKSENRLNVRMRSKKNHFSTARKRPIHLSFQYVIVLGKDITLPCFAHG
jgi:hypothetical protein